MFAELDCLSHGLLVFALCQAGREVCLVYETRMSCGDLESSGTVTKD